jgi:hypothetical protein
MIIQRTNWSHSSNHRHFHPVSKINASSTIIGMASRSYAAPTVIPTASAKDGTQRNFN